MNNTVFEKVNYKFLISFAIIIPVLLGISYAFFVPKISGSGGRIISGIAAEDIDFNLITENDGYIRAGNLVPLTEDQVDQYAEKGTFKIVSLVSNSNNIKYTIALTDIEITDNLKNADFKWAIECVNDKTKSSSGTFSVINNNQILLNKDGLPYMLTANATDEYILKLWIASTDQNQIDILNGRFSGKISATAEYVYIEQTN